VPVLEHWELKVAVSFDRGRDALLLLDDQSPLRSPHDHALGHVPEEIGVITRKLADDTWSADDVPKPRVVGAGRLCVPDLVLRHRSHDVAVAFEFFHRWHKHQLVKRLEDLRVRPDPTLIVCIDESLLGEGTITKSDAEAHPNVVLFKGFPSERKLRAVLERFA